MSILTTMGTVKARMRQDFAIHVLFAYIYIYECSLITVQAQLNSCACAFIEKQEKYKNFED